MKNIFKKIKEKYLYIILVILIIIGIILGINLYNEHKKYITVSENQYNYALYELVNYVQDVETYLAKATISSTSEHAAETLAEVWREANIALSYLSQLPISSNELVNTAKFLNQVSEYSYSLYRKNINGELIINNMSSLELVPGDLFEVPDEGITLPCDSILVKGSVVINESMLTGESTPIIKTCLENSEEIYNSKLIDNNSKYILYSGTKILQKKK